jgi:purine nucleosidase
MCPVRSVTYVSGRSRSPFLDQVLNSLDFPRNFAGTPAMPGVPAIYHTSFPQGFAWRFAILRRVKRLFLIDTDTASDDAVALLMALRNPHVEVLAITTVAGNVPVQQASRNALYTAELCGSDVPVFTGAGKPLKREHRSADWFHGRDGLSDHGYPQPTRAPEITHASDAIIDTIESHPGLVLVTLGPLTNIALALQKRPGIAARVGRCVVMGGAPCCEGNVTPAAEYNIWCDPEAARIVAISGLPIELVGWHLSRGEAVLNPKDIRHVLSFNNPLAKFAIECNSRAQEAFFEQTGEHGISLPDPVAMAVALDPSIVTSQSDHFVDVETDSELTRGMTVVDRLNIAANERNRDVWASVLAGGHRAKIFWTIDNVRWKQALYAALE